MKTKTFVSIPRWRPRHLSQYLDQDQDMCLKTKIVGSRPRPIQYIDNKTTTFKIGPRGVSRPTPCLEDYITVWERYSQIVARLIVDFSVSQNWPRKIVQISVQFSSSYPMLKHATTHKLRLVLMQIWSAASDVKHAECNRVTGCKKLQAPIASGNVHAYTLHTT